MNEKELGEKEKKSWGWVSFYALFSFCATMVRRKHRERERKRRDKDAKLWRRLRESERERKGKAKGRKSKGTSASLCVSSPAPALPSGRLSFLFFFLHNLRWSKPPRPSRPWCCRSMTWAVPLGAFPPTPHFFFVLSPRCTTKKKSYEQETMWNVRQSIPLNSQRERSFVKIRIANCRLLSKGTGGVRLQLKTHQLSLLGHAILLVKV